MVLEHTLGFAAPAEGERARFRGLCRVFDGLLDADVVVPWVEQHEWPHSPRSIRALVQLQAHAVLPLPDPKVEVDLALLVHAPEDAVAPDELGVADDVRGMQAVLAQCGVRTVPVLARTKADVVWACQFAAALHQNIRQLSFFYAGHATRSGPNAASLRFSDDTVLDPDALDQLLFELNPRATVVILDCCYAQLVLPAPPADVWVLALSAAAQRTAGTSLRHLLLLLGGAALRAYASAHDGWVSWDALTQHLVVHMAGSPVTPVPLAPVEQTAPLDKLFRFFLLEID